MKLGILSRSMATRTISGITALLLVGCQSELRGVGPSPASLSATSAGTTLQGTATTPATEAQVLTGEQYWDSTGTLQTGTMTNQGTLNAASSFPGIGYYTGVVNLPLASSITLGNTVLGIAGSATGAYSSCTDNALNAGQCSTAVSRYVSPTLGSAVSGTNGSLTKTIPEGFYNGATSCSMSDTNLVANKILSGTTIFGVSGSATAAYSSCTDNALNASACSTAASRYVATTAGSNVTGTNGSLSMTIPQGYYSGTQTATASDTNLVAGNIIGGVSIFGVTGSITNNGNPNFQNAWPGAGYYGGSPTNTPTASQIMSGNTILGVTGTGTGSFGANTGSNASRDIATTQITLQAEVTTYAGNGGTPNLPAGYRAVPDITKDDDGYNNTDADANCATDGSGCTPVVSITASQHAAFVNCGTTQTSVAARIADCATQNGAAATWNGATDSNGGQGSWKLVTRQGANKEVWQDQRTLLAWSSLVTTSDNWCIAAGNAQSNDPYGYCDNATVNGGSFPYNNGTVYQPNYPTAESYCTETGTIPALASEAVGGAVGGAWAGTYVAAKGGMGANSSTLKVKWRLPTINDYKLADVDGIRSVMPDMGAFSTGYEWSASLVSNPRHNAWIFTGGYGYVGGGSRVSSAYAVRCVGR